MKCGISHKDKQVYSETINTWLKIKEEANWTGKPEEKAAFIEAYYANEGILPEADKIEYNVGLEVWRRFL